MTRIALCSLVLVFAACQPSDDSSQHGRTKGDTSVVGGTSRSSTRYATDFGDLYEGMFCNAYSEGTAWCDDDYTIAYCSYDTWYLLDCTDIGYDVCGDDGNIVDCYVL